MSHVKINNKAKTDSDYFADGVKYVGENALKATCPYMCFDKAFGEGSRTFKRCVKSVGDCKTGQAKMAATVKTDVAKNFNLMTVATAGAAMNTTSCPTCTGATCDDTKAYDFE
eukprot:GHVU01168262.1.p2 GENE.GHVU01168262.1~~GHVU01168262.1.p2  ORF type:complete len:113 (-),score=22.82 GHVU01168262.1:56-394(-)